MSPAASVIVRCKDEASTIERTFRSLRSQSLPVEIIVVDSGSTDGSLEISRRYCDRLIEIPVESFSYGRSLNIGAEAAETPFHFALSAHCAPDRGDWIERSLAHYERDDVAATNGIQTLADGTAVGVTFLQDAKHARSNADWGFSNHASSWRGEVWRRHPFNEELDYAEDREWSWRVLDAGWSIAFDPHLWVDMSHAWRGGARDLYTRQRRGAAALREFAQVPSYGVIDLLEEWWSRVPDDGHSASFHRFNYRRLAGLLGKFVGGRRTP